MMKRYGKEYERWVAVRTAWFAARPQESFDCAYCGRWLLRSETTLDHVIPRSNARNYAHRHDDANLVPCCWDCNGRKGSRAAERFMV